MYMHAWSNIVDLYPLAVLIVSTWVDSARYLMDALASLRIREASPTLTDLTGPLYLSRGLHLLRELEM